MNYQKILEIVAKEKATKPQEVEREMQKAIIEAGYLMSPRAFIAMCCAKVKEIQQDNR